jgi:hypothetical protein
MSEFTDWQNSALNWDAPPFESCSPNLIELGKFLNATFPVPGVVQDLGCHGDRPVREGIKPSSHSFGAARDWRYGKEVIVVPADTGRHTCAIVLAFVLSIAEEAGIQSIHDYWADRIWRNNRDINYYPDGWKKQNGAGSGMGEAWANYLHFEVNLSHFSLKYDYFAAYQRWIGEYNMKLAELEIVYPPRRVYDSRIEGYKVPLPAGVQRLPVKKDGLVGASVQLTVIPANQNAGFFTLGPTPNSSLINWNPNSAGKAFNGSGFVLVSDDDKFEVFLLEPCHVCVDINAEG